VELCVLTLLNIYRAVVCLDGSNSSMALWIKASAAAAMAMNMRVTVLVLDLVIELRF
jgi:hypothetical protein